MIDRFDRPCVSLAITKGPFIYREAIVKARKGDRIFVLLNILQAQRVYLHKECGTTTKMRSIAETYARDPKFYGPTYVSIALGIGRLANFAWDGTEELVGS